MTIRLSKVTLLVGLCMASGTAKSDVTGQYGFLERCYEIGWEINELRRLHSLGEHEAAKERFRRLAFEVDFVSQVGGDELEKFAGYQGNLWKYMNALEACVKQRTTCDADQLGRDDGAIIRALNDYCFRAFNGVN